MGLVKRRMLFNSAGPSVAKMFVPYQSIGIDIIYFHSFLMPFHSNICCFALELIHSDLSNSITNVQYTNSIQLFAIISGIYVATPNLSPDVFGCEKQPYTRTFFFFFFFSTSYRFMSNTSLNVTNVIPCICKDPLANKHLGT